MRKQHPAGPIALPPCLVDAPYNIFDKDNVSKLVKRLLHSTAAGPSGWTAQLLSPLLGDAVCLDAVTLLAQLIAKDDLDEHSRQLLTCSILQGIPKPDSDDLRPLALGDLFVKIASKMCYSLDAGRFPVIFAAAARCGLPSAHCRPCGLRWRLTPPTSPSMSTRPVRTPLSTARWCSIRCTLTRG
jgi:hypothetical protein